MLKYVETASSLKVNQNKDLACIVILFFLIETRQHELRLELLFANKDMTAYNSVAVKYKFSQMTNDHFPEATWQQRTSHYCCIFRTTKKWLQI